VTVDFFIANILHLLYKPHLPEKAKNINLSRQIYLIINGSRAYSMVPSRWRVSGTTESTLQVCPTNQPPHAH
jgi:hypothetical protein